MNKVISYTVSKALAAAVIAAVLSVLSNNMLLQAQETKNAIAGAEGYTGYTGQNFIKTPENYLYKWFNERLPLKRPARPFDPAYYHARRHIRTGREGEFILDTNLVYGSTWFGEDDPAIAFDGTNYMLVWQDDRSMANANIYGSRITAGGISIDSSGIGITSNFENGAETPVIAYDGANYLVVFCTEGSDWCYDIYGVRVSPAGIVLDSAGIPISIAPDVQDAPCMAFGGSNYLIAWEDDRDGDYNVDIYCARVSPSGTVLDPSGVFVASRGTNPSVAFDGTNYLIVWETFDTLVYYNRIKGARVSGSGVVLEPGGVQIGTFDGERTNPSVTYGGANYFVVWQQSDTLSGDVNVVGTRVTPGMSVLDPTGVFVTASSWYGVWPAVSYDGTNYMVVWQGEDTSYVSRICCARVDQAGVVLDPLPIAITSNAVPNWMVPAIAYGTDYLVAWRDNWSGFSYDIYGARVSSSGVVLDSTSVNFSLGANTQGWPAAAFDGTNYLVAWMDTRCADATSDLYGIRVGPSGTVLDPASFVISNAQMHQYDPAAAFDGTNYFVVWGDERNSFSPDIYGARINPSGMVLDPTGIAVADGGDWQTAPALAFGDTNYFAVWSEADSLTNEEAIYGARVTPAGAVLDPNGIRLSFTGDYVGWSSIAFDGTNFLVVWVRTDTMTFNSDIYGTRVSQSGTVLDSAGIAISPGGVGELGSSIAFDGTNYLVTWRDFRSGFSTIYGTRVSTSGAVLDSLGIAISYDTTFDYNQRTAFDGSNFVTTWMNYDYNFHYCHLYGAKVSPSGAVVSRFPVVVQNGNQHDPALARGQGNQLLLAYSGWTDNLNDQRANAFRIWGKLYPFPNVEERAGQTAHLRNYLNIYPNPFSSKTAIHYTPGTMHLAPDIGIKVYNSAGQLVKSFALSHVPSALSISWQGDDDSGRKLPSGVYFVTLSGGGQTVTRKVMLIR